MSAALRLAPERARRFVLDNTAVHAPPHVPEIRLRLADEAHDLWRRTEEELAEIGLPPPFWAFAWAGGQGLARFVLDHPAKVKGKRVLDFASGSGLVAIAAALAGAAGVAAVDIDPFAGEAMALNAALNGVSLDIRVEDRVGAPVAADLLLAGDVFFDRAMAAAILPWFDGLAAAGTTILVGDPGRAYLPKDRLVRMAEYQVPVTRALEDAEVKRTTVWRWGR
ncbi:50S ribosomal protein L11 methyltransferase [Aureimonas endophytica]|uniref:50S ribosomal protein L11 methyltransferase n=1 Tax=Aureimonas endophytica TaxID=2027858 RepID=A0A917E6K3_9HYPH|nr:methyltransferase [Aureimonas endophytica]GGE08126.1 50S ribosomal protein L11 methyltransferase [Aureimonas endophytica]